ncbi:MAG TPA: mismatch-specific DNA-glycosylase, partial [Acidimicrobiia bacterium]|nr:mismatch-specific DNA-glycosylase [Acidimicrobiia bacterium]
YMHVPAGRVPMALAELHRSLVVGAAVHLQVTCDQLPPEWDDPFTGRHFSYFTTAQFVDVVEGAGFEVVSSGDDGEEWVDVEATRARMLPDTVGSEMRLLLVGLNPSLLSADTGVGFARPGNRFWPAALSSGLATRTHDPYHLLREHGVGMTNLVRRATVGAAELTNEEYREGAARVTRLVEWLRPRAICFVGLTGYRVAVDKKAKLGWQETPFASTPTYVMPNTSGLNAHAKPADFARHLAAAFQPAPFNHPPGG